MPRRAGSCPPRAARALPLRRRIVGLQPLALPQTQTLNNPNNLTPLPLSNLPSAWHEGFVPRFFPISKPSSLGNNRAVRGSKAARERENDSRTHPALVAPLLLCHKRAQTIPRRGSCGKGGGGDKALTSSLLALSAPDLETREAPCCALHAGTQDQRHHAAPRHHGGGLRQKFGRGAKTQKVDHL